MFASIISGLPVKSTVGLIDYLAAGRMPAYTHNLSEVARQPLRSVR
jgi:hypothetical protein